MDWKLENINKISTYTYRVAKMERSSWPSLKKNSNGVIIWIRARINGPKINGRKLHCLLNEVKIWQSFSKYTWYRQKLESRMVCLGFHAIITYSNLFTSSPQPRKNCIVVKLFDWYCFQRNEHNTTRSRSGKLNCPRIVIGDSLKWQ